MLRKLLTVLLPLALPFIAYGFYLLLARYLARRRAEGEVPGWADAPWPTILAVGVALTGATLIALRFYSGESIQGTYVAPHYEDGQIVPGGISPQ